MKRTDIERILKQGSVRQKIKLYMTDIALINVDLNNIEYEQRGEDVNILGTKLLSLKERELIINSIKEPKDKKYYKDLGIWNNAFLMFKDKCKIDLWKLQSNFLELNASYEKNKLVNEILDSIPDKKAQNKLLLPFKNTIIDLSNTWWNDMRKPTETAIETAQSCKDYIVMFKSILDNKLPLKPYRDWVEDQEEQLKMLITAIHAITTSNEFNTPAPPDFPKVKLYDEIDSFITEEDIEDFKNAGL